MIRASSFDLLLYNVFGEIEKKNNDCFRTRGVLSTKMSSGVRCLSNGILLFVTNLRILLMMDS